ncbi:methyltransferase domain-containing protein [Desulfonauticus submarinus]
MRVREEEKVENRLKEFLYMEWLRMEKVVWNTRASILIGEELLLGNRILEVGVGNGYFTFMTLGGRFKPEYDWYYNVNTEGFWKGKDIYDVVKDDVKISYYVNSTPDKKIVLAIDIKETLLKQAYQLGFIEEVKKADANNPLDFQDKKIDLVYSNILYWLKDPIGVLNNWEQNLVGKGKIVIVFPNKKFLEFCRSYKLSKISEFWKLINRNRAETLMWVKDLDEFEKEIEKNTNLKIKKYETYLGKTTLTFWDVGLRPISPYLIEMANSLSPKKRFEVKVKWCEELFPLVMELFKIELEETKGGYGAFNFVVLQKD